ncbi:MAG: hypothetical protein AB7O56_03485 [Bauldia sp.]
MAAWLPRPVIRQLKNVGKEFANSIISSVDAGGHADGLAAAILASRDTIAREVAAIGIRPELFNRALGIVLRATNEAIVQHLAVAMRSGRA